MAPLIDEETEIQHSGNNLVYFPGLLFVIKWEHLCKESKTCTFEFFFQGLLVYSQDWIPTISWGPGITINLAPFSLLLQQHPFPSKKTESKVVLST